jgi:uncharacterized repeat protein (TIGR01451 family)
VSVTSSQGTATAAGNSITADLGDLDSGASATVTIVVDVDESTRGTITNTARVTGTETETQPENNEDDEPTVVQAQVDLAITKSDSADPVTAGDQLTYTLNVTNQGPSEATDVVVQDTLPNEAEFVSANTSQGTVTHDQGLVTANLGDIAAGAAGTVTIVTQVDRNFAGTLNNVATVAGRETDTDEGNNSALEPTVVDELLGSLAGFVYVDADNDGVMDSGELPLAGVTVSLIGTDRNGLTIQRQAVTGEDGSYAFDDLPAGLYQIVEEQPTGYRDGKDTVGSAGGTSLGDDQFTAIQLLAGQQATDYLFGERSPSFSKRRFLSSR